MCSHGPNISPADHHSRSTAPTYPDSINSIKKKNLARLLAPIKWPSARSLSTAKSFNPLAAYFSLGSLLAGIHSYGFSMGKKNFSHTNFNKPGHP
jgi:hypothetical protein